MNALAFKALVSRQYELGEEIHRSGNNFRSAHQEENYFRKQMTDLQQLWAEFYDNHLKLEATQDVTNEKNARPGLYASVYYTTVKYYENVKHRKETIMDLYLNAAKKMYPNAKFLEAGEEEAVDNEDVIIISDDDDVVDRKIVNKHMDDILDYAFVGDDVKYFQSLIDIVNQSIV